MKGIVYVRVSSEEQVKGTSLDGQEKSCGDYCAGKGIEVLAVFREEGESAKTADRTEFLRAVEYCRKNKGKVDAFVVAKVDRFARNTEDHFYIRKILLGYGVTLHSVTEPIGNSPVGKFFETMLAGSAEFDNAIRTQRSTDGMIGRINQGIYPWKPPVGYTAFGSRKRNEKKTQPDPPDEKIFPIIQRGLREYMNGSYMQVELIKKLDAFGLAAARGRKTTSQLVDRILSDYLKFYAGIIVNPWTGEEKAGLHKPMITKDEMYKIQLVRSGKAINNVNRRKYNPEFPLRRTVYCVCGTRYTGSVAHGNGGIYAYYHCPNKQCVWYCKTIAKATLESDFVAYLEQVAPKEEFFAMFSESILDYWKEQGREYDLMAERYAAKLAGLEKKRQTIFDMREDGSYTPEEFRERKEGVENEIAAAKISLSEARIEQFDFEGALAYAQNCISNIGRLWFDLPEPVRPRFQKLVLPDGITYEKNKGFETARLSSIFRLNERFVLQKSRVVALIRDDWKPLCIELNGWLQFGKDLEKAEKEPINAGQMATNPNPSKD